MLQRDSNIEASSASSVSSDVATSESVFVSSNFGESLAALPSMNAKKPAGSVSGTSAGCEAGGGAAAVDSLGDGGSERRA